MGERGAAYIFERSAVNVITLSSPATGG
jgi:hypothetical protein